MSLNHAEEHVETVQSMLGAGSVSMYLPRSHHRSQHNFVSIIHSIPWDGYLSRRGDHNALKYLSEHSIACAAVDEVQEYLVISGLCDQ